MSASVLGKSEPLCSDAAAQIRRAALSIGGGWSATEAELAIFAECSKPRSQGAVSGADKVLSAGEAI